MIDRIIVPMCIKAKYLLLDGSEEALASQHCRKIIKIIAKTNPVIKFRLFTNGLLANRANFEELGIFERLDGLIFSLNAFHKKTYNKFMRGSNYEQVMKNVDFALNLYKQGILKSIALSFLVTRLNYRELIEFVEFAKKHSAHAYIIEFVHWDTKLGHELNILDKRHPAYNKLVNILNNKIFDYNKLIIAPVFKNLKKIGVKEYLKYRTKDISTKARMLLDKNATGGFCMKKGVNIINGVFTEKADFQKIQMVAFGLSTLCNYSHLHRKCPAFYCKEHKVMSTKIYLKVIDELAKYKFGLGGGGGRITMLHLYNEPLMDLRLFTFTKLAKKRLPKCRVGFTTNGFYLDQNIADDMKNYGVDAINISIYTREEHERLSKIKFNIPVEFRDYIDMSNQDGRADCYADSDKPAAKCKAAAPLFNIIINHNGDVCLCCIDWQYRYTFGNVLHEPLIKIINKPEFLKMSKLTSDGKQDLTCCKNCTGQYLARLPEQTVLFHPQHQWD